MIIRTLRLKNIKSYGEGPDGKGVTVTFEPGVNRIAGRNGHGKTTLIESLGYALFLAEPQFEDNFRTGTYLLRHGSSEGEIDVTFEHRGEIYRIERGVGAGSRRRTKVIQPGDGSICAEGDAEVERFLAALFGLGEPGRLSDLFSKLIGVRQGRLTWPFDSKATASKNFFEPLLEVEIFRRCFDELKPALDRIKDLEHKEEVELAGVSAKIQDRDNSPALVAEIRARQAKCQAECEKLGAAREKAREKRARLEEIETELRKLAQRRDRAKHAADSALQLRNVEAQRVAEAERASREVAENAVDHRAYLACEASLQEMRKRQRVQSELEQARAREEQQQTRLEGAAQGAEDQAAGLAGQRKLKEDVLSRASSELESVERSLAESEEDFHRAKALAEGLSLDREELRTFMGWLPKFLTERTEQCEKIRSLAAALDAWDESALAEARKKESEARERQRSRSDEVARARERRDSLGRQLEQIGGGVCPFLREECRQFDPGKVKGDVAATEQRIEELKAEEAQARRTLEEARDRLEHLAGLGQQHSARRQALAEEIHTYKARLQGLATDSLTEAAARSQAATVSEFGPPPVLPRATFGDMDGLLAFHGELERSCGELRVWWKSHDDEIGRRLEEIGERKSRRQADEQTRRNLREQVEVLREEITRLSGDEEKKRLAAAKARAEAQLAADRIAEIGQRLDGFSGLREKIAGEEVRLGRHRSGYEKYLGAKPHADQLGDRRGILDAKTKAEAACRAEMEEAQRRYAEEAERFDPEQLAAAKRECEEQDAAVATRREELRHIEAELNREEKRLEEWQQARRERTRIESELARLRASLKLGSLARTILKNAAPAVARHLCSRIATRAQRIYNRISREPVEIDWSSDNFRILITPGERRFAMLSGGEQTKLALAMTLALIQDFSDLRFCIFDEPTYAIDAESRSLLADAILEAQDAAGLEQMLLVSHDEAFEGKIENTLLVRKTPIEGSHIAAAP